MDKAAYSQIEAYMLACMDGSTHDREHIYRVLYQALDIARTEPGTDRDILVTACLLHDIGRPEQYADPSLCHAAVGGEKAYRWLLALGWPEPQAAHVRDCIRSHRFRSERPPATMEAKILFDADKLDACGAIGIARTLLYQGEVGQPLYSLREDGSVSDGRADEKPSFFREYNFKLRGLYDGLYTARAREIAAVRRPNAEAFYAGMLAEAENCRSGRDILEELLG